jgi:thioester reductase-like protein
LKLNEFFESPTFGRLIDLISHQLQPDESKLDSKSGGPHDLNLDAVLDEAIRPTLPASLSHPRNSILLTGSTGFLGAFLLSELLETTDANLYCLVRGRDKTEGLSRIHENLTKYRLWKTAYVPRITPVIGDLSEPLFGLSQREFDNLALSTDSIYHNGAILNFVYPYSALKPTNILGTQEVLRFASRSKTKPLHYVSTDAVYDSPRYYGQTIAENVDADHCEELDLGYTQSKWVAEKLVRIARDRGMPVTIYRPPLIAGHSETGAWYTDDFICRFLKGCIQLGCMPIINSVIEIAPVDYVSRAIVYLSRQEESIGKAFHLINPSSASWEDTKEWLNGLGYPVRFVPYPEWERALIASNQVENNHLRNLIPFFLNRWSGRQLTFPQLSELRARLDCRETVRALAGSKIECAAMTQKQLAIYLKYFISVGLFDPPDKPPAVFKEMAADSRLHV